MDLQYIFVGIPPAIVEFLISRPKTHESEGFPIQAKIKPISINSLKAFLYYTAKYSSFQHRS
jgi:hypothetical protein